MKKACVMLALACLPLAALADDLADAVKAWERRDFVTAHREFSRLANAGNPQAQQLLGEMYGFGDGVQEDPALARQWLERSRAAGNKEAEASLQVLQQRAARKAEIARYQAGGHWNGVSLAANGCVKPVFPAVSTHQDEIRAIGKQVADYSTCYEQFVAALPALKLPDDVANLMSLSELAAARAADDAALARVITQARDEAAKVIADNDAWVTRSKAYATAYNARLKTESDQRQREIDETTRRAREAMKH
jgi:TPR repeat protein